MSTRPVLPSRVSSTAITSSACSLLRPNLPPIPLLSFFLFFPFFASVRPRRSEVFFCQGHSFRPFLYLTIVFLSHDSAVSEQVHTALAAPSVDYRLSHSPLGIQKASFRLPSLLPRFCGTIIITSLQGRDISALSAGHLDFLLFLLFLRDLIKRICDFCAICVTEQPSARHSFNSRNLEHQSVNSLGSAGPRNHSKSQSPSPPWFYHSHRRLISL